MIKNSHDLLFKPSNLAENCLHMELLSSRCQFDDFIFQSGFNFANLKCQVVKMCLILGSYYISTSWHVKFEKLMPIWKKLGSSIVLLTPPNCSLWKSTSQTVVFACIALHNSSYIHTTYVLSKITLTVGRSQQHSTINTVWVKLHVEFHNPISHDNKFFFSIHWNLECKYWKNNLIE